MEPSEVSPATSEMDSGTESAAVSTSSTSLSSAKMPSPEKEADTTESQVTTPAHVCLHACFRPASGPIFPISLYMF